MPSEIPSFKFALREDIKDMKEFLPSRAHENDTGWDIRYAPQNHQSIIIKPFEYVKLPTGLRTKMPDGWWLSLVPRSSSFVKKHLHFLYGTVDCGFENEMHACFQYIPDGLNLQTETQSGFDTWNTKTVFNSFTSVNAPSLEIKFGEAIAQIIPVKLRNMEVQELSNEELDLEFKQRNGSRGTGGFGSTDVKVK